MNLTLSKNSVTWSAKELKSTVDLIFILESLLKAVTECTVRSNLHYELNHYLIVTYLDLTLDLKPEIKKQVWKNVDLEKILKIAKKLAFDLLYSLIIESEIDTYLSQITQILQQIIDQIVPWRKLFQKAQSFWTSKCSKLTKLAKKLRRQYKNSYSTGIWEKYQNIQIKKFKAIQKVKTFYFRESVHEAGISPREI